MIPCGDSLRIDFTIIMSTQNKTCNHYFEYIFDALVFGRLYWPRRGVI